MTETSDHRSGYVTMVIYPQPKPLPEPPEEPTRPARKHDAELEAWAKAVKERAGWQCEMKGIIHACNGPLDAAHVLGRGAYPSLRLDPENGVALCRLAHDRYDRTRWFKPWFRRWFDTTYPGRRARLKEKART